MEEFHITVLLFFTDRPCIATQVFQLFRLTSAQVKDGQSYGKYLPWSYRNQSNETTSRVREVSINQSQSHTLKGGLLLQSNWPHLCGWTMAAGPIGRKLLTETNALSVNTHLPLVGADILVQT